MGSSQGGQTGGLAEKVTLREENKMNANEKSCWIRARQGLSCVALI